MLNRIHLSNQYIILGIQIFFIFLTIIYTVKNVTILYPNDLCYKYIYNCISCIWWNIGQWTIDISCRWSLLYVIIDIESVNHNTFVLIGVFHYIHCRAIHIQFNECNYFSKYLKITLKKTKYIYTISNMIY